MTKETTEELLEEMKRLYSIAEKIKKASDMEDYLGCGDQLSDIHEKLKDIADDLKRTLFNWGSFTE